MENILEHQHEITTVVFEKRDYRYRNLKLASQTASVQQVEVLIQSLVKYKYKKKIYYFDSEHVSRQNELHVGRERVVSWMKVKDMIRKSNHEFKIELPELVETFLKQCDKESGNKEQLAKSFLLAFSFYEHLEFFKNKKE